MFDVSHDKLKPIHNSNLLELVLSVTGSRDVQAVLSVPSKMTQTNNQDLIRYRKQKNVFFYQESYFIVDIV
jgi:hypothetical protein